MNKLRVWWIPQVPMKSFNVEVESVEEGIKILDTLSSYDIFQIDNNIKPDCCNVGGLQLFDPEDKEDSPEGSWVDWYYEDELNYFDDPDEYLEWKRGEV